MYNNDKKLIVNNIKILSMYSSSNVSYHLGNNYIFAMQKILFVNEIKSYKIHPRLKGWAQKIFETLLPKFV